MKRINIFSFILVFIFIGRNTAQNRFDVSLGGGYISPQPGESIIQFTNNGYLINFSLGYKVTNRLSLYFSSSYNNLIYNNEPIPITVPALAGFHYKTTVENSTIYEFSLGGKYFLLDSRIRPYFAAGIGALYMNIGKVEFFSSSGNNFTNSEEIYHNALDDNFIFQVNAGFGSEIYLTHGLSLLLDVKIVSGLSYGVTYFPLSTSVKLNI